MGMFRVLSLEALAAFWLPFTWSLLWASRVVETSTLAFMLVALMPVATLHLYRMLEPSLVALRDQREGKTSAEAEARFREAMSRRGTEWIYALVGLCWVGFGLATRFVLER